MPYDVIIVGGGPSGLSAALALGRGRKSVLLCDGGPRRNAAAERVHNFVTRDGTPPEEFRQIGRQQLTAYPKVEVRDACVEAVTGSKGAFRVVIGSDTVVARRILLCTGLIDEPLPIDGFPELWGSAIFQCPYCHGWEVQDRPWGYLAQPVSSSHFLPFVLKLRGWTNDLVVFTNGACEIPKEERRSLMAAGIRVETARVVRFVAEEQRMKGVELEDGTRVPCDVLFTHPPQQQVELVRTLGLALDDDGFVQIDSAKRETSVPGIYASGDLTTRIQGAVLAAASGVYAATSINLDLTVELASAGAL